MTIECAAFDGEVHGYRRILGWNDWKFEFCLKINQPKQFQALGPPLRPPLPPKGEPIAAPVPPPRRNKHSSGRSSSSRFTPSPLSSQVSSNKHIASLRPGA